MGAQAATASNEASLSAARPARGDLPAQYRVAVMIPCYNEEVTVGDVVRQIRAQLPRADIYVFDNNSSDRTVQKAGEAGAVVLHERRQGKGYVVQSMFRQVDADIYIMLDGDGTYPAASVSKLIAPLFHEQADMVVGSRLHTQSQSQFKSLNRLGNGLLLAILNSIFKVQLTDLLSGYRAFSRKFVRGISLSGGGFEIETELTIKALERGYRIVEVPVDLGPRPEGSHSKIRLIRDGFIILNTIVALFRDYKPLTFFGILGLLFAVAGFIPGLVVIIEFLDTGLVLRMPSAILAVGLLLSGMLLATVGLILHTIVRRFQELEHYLRGAAGELSITNRNHLNDVQ